MKHILLRIANNVITQQQSFQFRRIHFERFIRKLGGSNINNRCIIELSRLMSLIWNRQVDVRNACLGVSCFKFVFLTQNFSIVRTFHVWFCQYFWSVVHVKFYYGLWIEHWFHFIAPVDGFDVCIFIWLQVNFWNISFLGRILCKQFLRGWL